MKIHFIFANSEIDFEILISVLKIQWTILKIQLTILKIRSILRMSRFETWDFKLKFWSLSFEIRYFWIEVWDFRFDIWVLKIEIWNSRYHEIWDLRLEIWHFKFEHSLLKFEIGTWYSAQFGNPRFRSACDASGRGLRLVSKGATFSLSNENATQMRRFLWRTFDT